MNNEIDLHGYKLNEALEKARIFIEDNYYAGAKSIRIIHGRGDGILRNGVREIIENLQTEKKLKLKISENPFFWDDGAVTTIEMGD